MKTTKQIDDASPRPSRSERALGAHRAWRFAAEHYGERHAYTRQLWAEYMALASDL